MPILSPAGPLTTLEETVLLGRKHSDTLEAHFQVPVLLLVAPAEEWAAETTEARPIVTTGETAIRVQMMPTLVFELRGDHDISFGRALQNAVVLPFAAMSKHHGFFREEAGAWLVGDAGSKNGTYIDGARVTAGALLPVRDGGSLRFGDVTAKFWLPKSFCLDLRRRMRPKG